MMEAIAGEWSGTNKLWFEDPTEPELSEGRATVGPNRVDYTWSFRGKPQRGTIELGLEGGEVTCEWTDTWHSQKPMRCRGTADAERIALTGSYAAGEETWGWRIELALGRFSMRMYNVTPTGEEQLAVELAGDRAG